jgi:hypothetical protein
MIKKMVTAILILAVVFFGSVIAFFLHTASIQWHFPTPGGRYKIGVTDFAVTDTSRIDPFAADSKKKRELLLWIWYPCEPVPGAVPLKYGEKAPGVFPQLAKMLSLPEFLFNSSKNVQTHSYWKPPVSRFGRPFPVLVFSHGFGIGTVGQNMAQFEELVSHGYTIVCIAHTYESCMTPFPDGRAVPADMTRWKEFLRQIKIATIADVLPAMNTAASARLKDSLAGEYIRLSPLLDESHRLWTDDTRFVIRELFAMQSRADSNSVAALFDCTRIGVFGHSLGGMTAQKVIREDTACRAGISYDSPPIAETFTDSMAKPFMFMMCENFRAASDPVFSRCKSDAYGVMIRGTTHFNFCDFSLSLSHSLFWRKTGFIGAIDGYRCEQIISSFTLNFFDKYLKEKNVDLVQVSKDFPETEVKAKNVKALVDSFRVDTK